MNDGQWRVLFLLGILLGMELIRLHAQGKGNISNVPILGFIATLFKQAVS